MKRILLVITLALSMDGVAASDQECGSAHLGGIIGPGNYVGLGASCKEAKQNLKINAGITNPTCEGCPPEELGCIPGTIIPDETNWDVGNCHFDEVLQKWIVVGTCTASTPWDKVCSSCN